MINAAADGVHGGTRNCVVIGAGFTGLAAAYELARRGLKPLVIEAEAEAGGLAGTFRVNGARLERFYHHWFTSDRHLMALVAELGLTDRLAFHRVETGIYYAHSLYRLSSPLDVLKFRALSPLARVRLGLLPLLARRIRSWEELDDMTAAEWLLRICGREVLDLVWNPLLRGKFGAYADQVSAAWFWSKLRLRGGSRDAKGHERLVYFDGGFAAVIDALIAAITRAGGRVVLGQKATALEARAGHVTGVAAGATTYPADGVILTTALPDAAALMQSVLASDEFERLRRIAYLANRCIVLELDRPLSGLYWINVNDPGFPFVGVIEHTNFADAAEYGGRHMVYLSRYCVQDDPFLKLDLEAATAYAADSLKRMFPHFSQGMIRAAHSWQASWAQPIVTKGYRRLVPPHETPIGGLYLATMAQVYPEDRGTNYAIRDGRKVAGMLAEALRE
jgi:protoporphyrinogen oxidase